MGAGGEGRGKTNQVWALATCTCKNLSDAFFQEGRSGPAMQVPDNKTKGRLGWTLASVARLPGFYIAMLATSFCNRKEPPYLLTAPLPTGHSLAAGTREPRKHIGLCALGNIKMPDEAPASECEFHDGLASEMPGRHGLGDRHHHAQRQEQQ